METDEDFSEISETESQYLKLRTLQKHQRNAAPGSAGTSPNNKKIKITNQKRGSA
ncbi:hypothetical protein [Sodalis sp.]|uniref:hypothetical protein n=1 Tax=Sodalis sp. (in: enterobacteria) TaxID=1898979 RepID=UPI00387379F6